MLLLALAAQAMLPRPGPGVAPSRAQPEHPAVQARLARQPAWTTFTAGLGAGWQARFDERTGAPRTAWGPPLHLRDSSGADAVGRSVAELLDTSGLVAGHRLVLRSVRHAADTDTWYVELDETIDGLPVWRGGVSARVRFGALFLVHLRLAPEGPPLAGPGGVDATTARVLAATLGPLPEARHLDSSARRVALPWGPRGTPRAAWEVRSRTVAPAGRPVALVDATTGELLAAWDELPTLSGTLTGVHDTRGPDGDLTESPLPYAAFAGSSGGLAWSDADGAFVLSDDETWTTSLSGSWLRVRNDAGDEGALGVSDGAPRWTDAAATMDEIDNYVFVLRARDWGLRVDPDNEVADRTLTSTVAIDGGECNAWYDGNLNFYAEGETCQSFGRLADVAYHEWGHAFHEGAVEGGATDTTVGEGTGDMVAAFLTHDAVISPGAHKDGTPVRDIEPDRVYPADLVGEVHTDGLIWAGAVWDAWGAALVTTGEDRADEGVAWTVMATDFARALRAGPTLETAYTEMLAADDDNGDLSDGTPHQCELWQGFAPHGLGPVGTVDGYAVDHAPLGNQPADTPIPVDARLVDHAAACRSTAVTAVTVDWSVDEGATWSSTALVADGLELDGELPGWPDGTVVWYTLSVTTDDGTVVRAPADGARAAWSFYVGPLELLGCEDFEADDGGYTHAPVEGAADDWEWGTPAGDGGDPSAAWSGSNVWGNDLGVGRADGLYRAATTSRLEAPPIPLAGATAVVVQFRRWLTVEDARWDRARFEVDGVERWSNVGTPEDAERQDTEDGDWVLHTVRVDGVGDTLALAWELAGDAGPSLGGWNLDDVCVWVPSFGLPDDTSTTPTDDTGTTGPTDDTGGPAGDDTGAPPKDTPACGCAVGAGAGGGAGALAGLLLLVGARRRRPARA